jgi:prophage DNA circulation protein
MEWIEKDKASMAKIFNRILGIVLCITAVFGILISLTGLAAVWWYKPEVTTSLLSDVNILSNALDTTSRGLNVASQSISTSLDSVSALEKTVGATARTLDATTPTINTMVTLARVDLPTTISTVQTSLIAAQQSAKIIDDILTALTAIPFISGETYNPPVPLNVALQQISESLDSLPASLDTIQKSLSTTRDNLATIQADIQLIAADIAGIHTSLEAAQKVIEDYQTLVSDLQVRTNRVQAGLPGWIDILAMVTSFLLVWMGISQIGLFLQGWSLVETGGHTHPAG